MDYLQEEIDFMLNEMEMDNPYINKINDLDILYDYILYQYTRFKNNKFFDPNYELYSEDIYKNVKQIEKYNDKLIEDPLRTESSVYICKKCKSKNTSYQLIQRRGADEALDVDIICNDCGYKWTER